MGPSRVDCKGRRTLDRELAEQLAAGVPAWVWRPGVSWFFETAAPYMRGQYATAVRAMYHGTGRDRFVEQLAGLALKIDENAGWLCVRVVPIAVVGLPSQGQPELVRLDIWYDDSTVADSAVAGVGGGGHQTPPPTTKRSAGPP